MAAAQIVEGLWQISLGVANAFLIDDDGELTLIDTGVPRSEKKILQTLHELGRTQALKNVIVTHCHPDHSGSLAALKQLTGATTHMHPADAILVRQGKGKRPLAAAPGLLRKVLFQLFVARADGRIEPAAIDRELEDGAVLPIAGGLQAIHAPGHCAGQVALLWRSRGVLFAADACSNVPGFGYSLAYENLEEGIRSLRKLSALDFDVACFGHGKPIMRDAARTFRRKWGTSTM